MTENKGENMAKIKIVQGTGLNKVKVKSKSIQKDIDIAMNDIKSRGGEKAGPLLGMAILAGYGGKTELFLSAEEGSIGDDVAVVYIIEGPKESLSALVYNASQIVGGILGCPSPCAAPSEDDGTPY